MLVKITDDLMIDIEDVYKIHKVGKDIFVYCKNVPNFFLSVYEKEGKEFLKYFRKYCGKSDFAYE